MLSTRAVRPFPPGLYAVVDDTVRVDLSLQEKGARLLEGRVPVIQLRLKRTPMREALEIARELALRCRAAGTVLVINDRVDLAQLSGAHGVHLGDEDLPPEEARRVLGPEAIIGVTVRSLQEARAAHAQGAAYAGIGPVFSTQTKVVNAPQLGLEGLAEIAAHSPLPLVAIAGITGDNIGDVARTGVHSAAVVSDLLLAEDIPARARVLHQLFLDASAKMGVTG
ncbi:MAG: thiamine phosphate synthase [Myxococcota bacterium]|nr:thiamine phosphate synthase [Myxococcota bacterium]